MVSNLFGATDFLKEVILSANFYLNFVMGSTNTPMDCYATAIQILHPSTDGLNVKLAAR